MRSGPRRLKRRSAHAVVSLSAADANPFVDRATGRSYSKTNLVCPCRGSAMIRKSDNGNPAAASRAQASLKTLRTQIDKLDLNILKLVNERAQLASEIGRVK